VFKVVFVVVNKNVFILVVNYFLDFLNTQHKHILETKITNIYEAKQTPMGIMLVIQGEYGKFAQVSDTSTQKLSFLLVMLKV
jgi:hypothetical protein